MSSEADFDLARRAVDLGWVTRDQVKEALLAHEKSPSERLLRFLPLTPDQVAGLSTPPPPEVKEAMRDPANLVGPFVLVKHLGTGGMGKVFQAWDPRLGRPVAVKLLKTDDARARAALLREARVAAKLSHPNIAPVHEVGEHAGAPFIVMRLIDGSTLAEAPRERAAEIVAVAAEAVAYAHSQGVLHRDLKPANIMIDRDGGVFVMDYGLAKAVDEPSGLSGSNVILGTAEYMAPEQARGGTKEIDERTDVYGLGACLYEALTGRPPFVAESKAEVLLQVLQDRPRRLAPAVPPDLEAIVLHCLEKDKARRYANALELAEDLRRFLRGEPVRAPRRRPALRALAMIAVVAILGFAAVSLLRRGGEPRVTGFSADPLLQDPNVLATDGTHLYVAGADQGRGVLVRIPLDGRPGEKLAVPYPCSGLALIGDELYWMDSNTGVEGSTAIYRMRKDGSGGRTAVYVGAPEREPIVDGHGMATDGRHLYTVDAVGGAAHRLGLDGTDIVCIGPARYGGRFDTEHMNSIAVSGGFVYVADAGRKDVIEPQIVRIGANDSKILHSGAPLIRPVGIAAGPAHLFIADRGAGNTIWRIPLEGGALERVVSGPPFVEISALLYHDGVLYVADTGNYIDSASNLVDGPGAIFKVEIPR